MDLSPAPFFEDMAGVPAGGKAHWLNTADNTRIRVGHWLPEGDACGTVMMFPGRTEYIEKYGDCAAEFTGRGFAFLAVDWRGQGLADRLLDDPCASAMSISSRTIRMTFRRRWIWRRNWSCQTLVRDWPFDGRCDRFARDAGKETVSAACAFTGPMWGIFFTPS